MINYLKDQAVSEITSSINSSICGALIGGLIGTLDLIPEVPMDEPVGKLWWIDSIYSNVDNPYILELPIIVLKDILVALDYERVLENTKKHGNFAESLRSEYYTDQELQFLKSFIEC